MKHLASFLSIIDESVCLMLREKTGDFQEFQHLPLKKLDIFFSKHTRNSDQNFHNDLVSG